MPETNVNPKARTDLLRAREPNGQSPVSNMELFFDLVYVFAITQLSHYVLHHPTIEGVLQGTILFLAVWWAWIFTTWATNWIDPERTPIRILLALVMMGSLVLSATIPKAFADYGIWFALAYVAIQIGRTVYTAWAMGEWHRGATKNLTRAMLWFIVSGAFWIAGGLSADIGLRCIFWLAALAIEYAGPFCYFYVPGLGRSRSEEWRISGGHMAERCALLVIIALGEGIVLTGATFADAERVEGSIAAFFVAFLSSVAMWWIYFDLGAKRGAHHIERHDDPGRVARNAYTYAHIPLVAGIILAAVIDEQILAHPYGHVEPFFLWIMVAAGFLFLGGTALFKRITSGNPWFPLSHIVGIMLFAAIAAWGWFGHPQPLTLAAAAALTYVTVAVWEWFSFHGGWIERIERRGGRIGRAWKRVSDAWSERIEARRR